MKNNNHDNHITSNVTNSKNIINEFYDAGCEKIISMGSGSEYGDKVGLLKETDENLKIENNYVRGKRLVSNHGIETSLKLNRKFIHIRLFYTYGSGQSKDSLINQLFNKSRNGEEMNLSPCMHYRDYIHISEVTEGINKLLNVEESGIINLGSGSFIQLKEFVKKFWTKLGSDVNQLNFGAHVQPEFEQTQTKSYADLEKIQMLTGWKPNLSIDQGIDLTIKGLRKRYL